MSKEITPNSMIGEGAIFVGKFKVAGSFRIDGQYEGELSVENHLYISPIGKLKTDTVYVKTVAIAGIFMGNVDASEEVHLLSTGRILGNIKAPKLIMEPGVVVQGTIDITGANKSPQIMNHIESAFHKDELNQDFKKNKKDDVLPQKDIDTSKDTDASKDAEAPKSTK